MKADIVVFRDSNGKACVRPGVHIVELDHNLRRAEITIGNHTTEPVVAIFSNNLAIETLVLNPTNQVDHSKKINLGKFGRGVFEYRVFVGSEEAQGNSAPMLIIDD
jgi:hypothetical protein